MGSFTRFQVSSFQLLKLKHLHCDDLHIILLFCFLGSVVDIDECATNVHNCDALLASCANSIGSFVCTCNQGYSGDGITCSGEEAPHFFQIAVTINLQTV